MPINIVQIYGEQKQEPDPAYGYTEKCPQYNTIKLLVKKFENAQKFLGDLLSFQVPHRPKSGLINTIGEIHKFL